MNRKANTEPQHSHKKNSDASIVTNPSSSSDDDIDCYQEWMANFHAEQPNKKHESSVTKPPPLFEGDVVCIHEIFEWLSLKDIHSVGQTCKRLHAIAGDFFNCYLPATELQCTEDGIRSKSLFHRSSYILNGFRSYVRKIEIMSDDNDKPFQHIASIKFAQLKKLIIIGVVTKDQVENIKDILKNIEAVELKLCKVRGDMYNCLLKFCPNLKHLIEPYRYFGTNNQWLAKIYPKLEHIELYQSVYSKMCEPEVETFFNLNPQIKSLATDLVGLWLQSKFLLKSKIQLDVLAITIDCIEDPEEEDEIFAFLYQLYDQGFYKRLHVRDQNPLDERVATFPGLEMLTINHNGIPFKTSTSLPGLKELTLDLYYIKSIDVFLGFVRKLPNLERLNLRFLYNVMEFNLLLPFLQHCPKLNKVKIGTDGNELNVSAWNNERGKLTGARKVTIFVEEQDYLNAKWASKSINLEFIEIRRADSYEWNELIR